MTNSKPSAIIMNEVCSECQREKSLHVCKSLQKSVNEDWCTDPAHLGFGKVPCKNTFFPSNAESHNLKLSRLSFDSLKSSLSNRHLMF